MAQQHDSKQDGPPGSQQDLGSSDSQRQQHQQERGQASRGSAGQQLNLEDDDEVVWNQRERGGSRNQGGSSSER